MMVWETFLLDTAYCWGDKVWPSVFLSLAARIPVRTL